MLSDFLDTKLSKRELTNALEVIEAFKANESNDEWFFTDFQSWVKLEQLEEFLKHLVRGEPLEKDTLEHLEDKKKMMKEVME